MKDLTHYFQSPNKVVNTISSSLEEFVVIEESPPELNSGHNGSVSSCFEGTCESECNESASTEISHVCEPKECLVEENSNAISCKPKASGKLSGYYNGISNCDEHQEHERLGRKSRKKLKKESLENGDDASDERFKPRDPGDSSADTPVSPNAFQILMSTQQLFSTTNSGRKNCLEENVENSELKRENKKKIKENLEQMAKRRLEMEATMQACENTIEKSAKKRRRIIVESDPENEATLISESSADTTSDEGLDKKRRKLTKSNHKIKIKRKQKRSDKVSDDVSIQTLKSGSGVKCQKLNNKNENNLKCVESNGKSSKNMKVKVCTEQSDTSKENYMDLQNSASDTKDKEDSEVVTNVSDNVKSSDSDLSIIIRVNDISDTPDITKKKGNILNYFNKVTGNMKLQHIEKIKVTADIHFPVVSAEKVSRKVVTKRRSKKKAPSEEDDIQLIDSEVIEKQDLPLSETNKISVAFSESKMLSESSPSMKTDSNCEVICSPPHEDWKLRIRIPSLVKADKKCESSFKKNKLKISDKRIKNTRNNEISFKITSEETNEVSLLSNNPRTEEKEKAAMEKKLSIQNQESPSSSSPKKKKKKFSIKLSPVKSKVSRDKDDSFEKDEQIVDKNESVPRMTKEVLGSKSTKSKNSPLRKGNVTPKEKCSAGVKLPTSKGRRTLVTDKGSTKTLNSEASANKESPLTKRHEVDHATPEKNTVKNTLKRKCAFLFQEPLPCKKSVVISPVKKSVKNKSPAKGNLLKKETITPKRHVVRAKCFEEKEFHEETFIKKNDSKRDIEEDSCLRKKEESPLSTKVKKQGTEEKDETLASGRAKRSCTTKNTAYIEDEIDSRKKSRGVENSASRRKRSCSSRNFLHEERNTLSVNETSEIVESISSSAGRRSSSRKKFVSPVADYGISDEDDEDFDTDSDDDFFGDSDDYLDSDCGDSDENLNGDSDDYEDGDDSTFDMKKNKNDKEEKIDLQRKLALIKRKKALAKSTTISNELIEAALQERRARSKGKRAPAKGIMLDQDNVLQFLKKAKGTLNRKMALHDPDNFSCKQTIDMERKSAPVKLAPVFVSQKMKKPDKATLLARKSFLQSGVPEIVKKMVEIKKLAEEQEHIEFPSISHVQQKEDKASIWNLSDALQKFPPTSDVFLSLPLKISMGDFTKCKAESAGTLTYNASHLPKIQLFRDYLRCIKAESPEFPVYRTFRHLFEASHPQQLDIAKGNAAKKGKRRSSVAKKEHVSSAQDSEQRCAAWAAKYQPLSSDNILGNGYNISRLKKWLELWVQVKENTFQKNFKEDVSSGDEFLNDASDDESGKTVLPKKSVVLKGPTGSGKTMTVYALAHELGYKVLEVNAASKRTGRRILSELLEATQSHQVQGKGDEASPGIKSFFSPKGTLEKAKQLKKETEQQTSKLSLILVEDVDIVFEEEDEGFVSALSTLVVGSKRPVVLVTSDPSCPHLPRFMENSLVLDFKPAPSKLISVWMQLVVLLEGVRVRKSCMEELLKFNKGDIRKTLLQLQFWVLSGGDNSKSLPESSYETPEVQDFPDDLSNSSWVSIDEKKSENETNHRLHSQCLSTFLELDAQILSIDRGKIWWNMPKLAGLDEVSHVAKTSEKCDNESKKKLASVAKGAATIEEINENTSKDDNEAKKKWKSVCTTEDVKVLLQLADTLSTVEMLSTVTDCVANEPYHCAWEKDPLDSLSLCEDMQPSEYGTKLTAQSIGNWLVSAAINQASARLCTEKQLPIFKVIQQQPAQEEMRWREQQHNASREFQDAIPMQYWPQRRAIAMDYISFLRTISRLEQDRVSFNDKRNNRFFHYLRGLGALPSPVALDTACNVFKIHDHI